jgi:AcrR family transcriptional regulator
VRAAILEAASHEFSARGFAETTMRSVASSARISLSVLHRHFDSKERLFSATLLAPFLGFVDDFAAAWREQLDTPWDDERLMGEYVADLYTNLTRHRMALVHLVSASESTGTLLAELRAGLAPVLLELQAIGEHEARTRGWFSEEAARQTTWLVAALVTGLVLMEPWRDPEGKGLAVADERTMIEAATKFATWGTRLAPPESRPPPPSAC